MKKEIGWLLKEKYFGKPTKQFEKDVERLKAGEPAAYVIGFCDFLGCKINLSKRPLIPRVETEYWVEKAIEEIKNRKSFDSAQDKILTSSKMLDIFSGSGCVGISIMRHIKSAKMVFAEKDKKCLKQIKINLKINKVNKKRYKIIQSDIFKNVTGKFDYILANPPYIPTTKKPKLPKSVISYEPNTALFGGSDGLQYIRKFLAEAKNFLAPSGKIYLEFDTLQKPAIEKILKTYQYGNWEFKKDQYHRARYVIIYT